MYVDHVTGSNLLEFRCVQSRRRVVVGISDDSRRDKKVAGSANFGTSPSSPTWVKSLLSFVSLVAPHFHSFSIFSLRTMEDSVAINLRPNKPEPFDGTRGFSCC